MIVLSRARSLLPASLLCAAVLAAALGGSSARATSDPTGGCPPRAAAPSGSRPAGPLVPGNPASIHVCRYGATAGVPAGQATFVGYGDSTDAAAVRRLARLLRRLPRPPKGLRNCPAGDGAEVVAMFRYRSGRQLTVTLELSGCRTVRRGAYARDGLRPPGGTILRTLDSLVVCAGGCPASPAPLR